MKELLNDGAKVRRKTENSHNLPAIASIVKRIQELEEVIARLSAVWVRRSFCGCSGDFLIPRIDYEALRVLKIREKELENILLEADEQLKKVDDFLKEN